MGKNRLTEQFYNGKTEAVSLFKLLPVKRFYGETPKLTAASYIGLGLQIRII